MIRQPLVLVASLMAIALLETGHAKAQVFQDPTFRGDPQTLSQPVVLAGPDVGFRVIRMDGAIPLGQLVVRINGAWVPAEVSK